MSHGFECPGIDGDNWNNDAGEEKRGQLVNIFHSDKNHHSHQAEADSAVNSHVVQHGTVTPMGVRGVKYGRLGDQIFLRRKKKNRQQDSLYVMDYRGLFRDHIYAYKCEVDGKIFLHTDQEDFDGPQYVHGRSKGGAQVEAQPHSSTELGAEGAWDHEVCPSSYNSSTKLLDTLKAAGEHILFSTCREHNSAFLLPPSGRTENGTSKYIQNCFTPFFFNCSTQ